MNKIQYASIPIEFLEIIKSSDENAKLTKFKPFFNLKLSFYNPSNKYKMKSVIVKIKMDKNPYVEELLTNNKIGLNKKDGYKIYLKGDAVYKLCTKQEAYIKIVQQLNYKEEINRLFN